MVTIGWAPDGPLPRRSEPVDVSSIAQPGLALQRTAASRPRTLPDGSLAVVSAPAPRSGTCTAVRVGAGAAEAPLSLGPAASELPGWRLLDFVAEPAGGWLVLEAVPGPPDEVRLRRLEADGATRWSTSERAGSDAALAQILTDGRSSYVVTGGPAPRILTIGAGGPGEAIAELPGPASAHFMNGSGTVGFVGEDPASGARAWVTVDVGSGERARVEIDAADAWGLDLPIGMDGHGRPYANRHGTLVRFDARGRPDWELGVVDAVVRDERVWLRSGARSDAAIVVLARSGDDRRVVLEPPDAGAPAYWRLADALPDDDAFVLYARPSRADAGVLARVRADGTLVSMRPAPEDVWRRTFDLQIPQPPAVTDAGEIDLATRGPNGLSIVRLTPAAPAP